MAKERTRYVCSNCGEVSLSWAGKCPQCGEWNTLQEELVRESAPGKVESAGRQLEAATVGSMVSRDLKRMATGLGDTDVVLGGGIVAGSVSLIAGQPGIGKST